MDEADKIAESGSDRITRSKRKQKEGFSNDVAKTRENASFNRRVERTFLDVEYGDEDEDMDEDYRPEQLLEQKSSLYYNTRSRTNDIPLPEDLLDIEGIPLLLSEVDNPDYMEFISTLNGPVDFDIDEAEDPDYIFLNDQQFKNIPLADEICMSKETEIPRREVRTLLADLNETTSAPFDNEEMKVRSNEEEVEKYENILHFHLRSGEPSVCELDEVFHVACCPDEWDGSTYSSSLVGATIENPCVFFPKELNQLGVQLTKHVQLLTQFVVSCGADSSITSLRSEFLKMLNEFTEKCSVGPSDSIFNTLNHRAAVDTCQCSETITGINLFELNNFTHRKVLAPKPEVMVAIACSSAIVYPELIPEARPLTFNTFYRRFTPPEDCLLALALNQCSRIQYFDHVSLRKRNMLISRHLLPLKYESAIGFHMKYLRKSELPIHRLTAKAESQKVFLVFPTDDRRTMRSGPPFRWDSVDRPIWLKVLLKQFTFVTSLQANCIVPANNAIIGGNIPVLQVLAHPGHFIAEKQCSGVTKRVNQTAEASEYENLEICTDNIKINLVSGASMECFVYDDGEAEVSIVDHGEPGQLYAESCDIGNGNVSSYNLESNHESTKGDDDVEKEDVRVLGRCQHFSCHSVRTANINHRERRKKALSYVTVKDREHEMLMHQDKVGAICKLIIDRALSAQMFEDLAAVLGSENEDLLIRLSFIFPLDHLPDHIMNNSLRKTYERAFDMIFNIKEYDNLLQSERSTPSVFCDARETQTLCTVKELQKMLERLLWNKQALVDIFSMYLPVTVDEQRTKSTEDEFVVSGSSKER